MRRPSKVQAKTLFILVVILLAGGTGLITSHSVRGWPVDLPGTTTSARTPATGTGVLETKNVTLSGASGSMILYSTAPPPPPNAEAPPPASGPMIIGNTTYTTPTNPPSTLNVTNPNDPPVDVWRNVKVCPFPGCVQIGGAAAGGGCDACEPSVAANGNTIFYTANWFAALSKDGGNTWTFPNPVTDINNKPWGFCCDQDVVFAPNQQVFLWYRQGLQANSQQNILTVVTSSGQVACDWKFGPSNFGFGSDTWFDYPQLAIGRNYLYITTNLFTVSLGSNRGTLALRFSVDQLQGCGKAGADAFLFHYDGCGEICPFTSMAPVTGVSVGFTMFFAANTANNILTVFEWPQSGKPVAYDVLHPPFNSADVVCKSGLCSPASCPVSDGTDPCNFFDSRVLGGWVDENKDTGIPNYVYFYWSVKQDKDHGFPFPWTYVLKTDPQSIIFHTIDSIYEIWSPNYAMVFASITPNFGSDFVAVNLVVAGGSTFPSTALAITKASMLGNSGFQVFDLGRNGPNEPKGVNRWGDYLRIRPYYGGAQVKWEGSWVASEFRKTNSTAFEFRVYFLSAQHVTPTLSITYPTDGAVVDLTPGHANPDFVVQVNDPQGAETCLSMSNLAWQSDIDGTFANSCDFGATLAGLGKFLSPGVQHIHVTATDKEGESLTSNSVTFTLIIPQPTVVITNPANNQQIPQGQQVTLQGVAYQSPNGQAQGLPPIDCNQLAWSWFDPSGVQILGACGANGKTFELPYTFNTIGSVTLTLRAAYGKVGLLKGGSATVTVNVVAKSTNLFVSITSPFNGQTYYATYGPLPLTGTVSGGTGIYPTITWEADWASGTYTITTGALSYGWNIAGTLCQNPKFTPAYASTLPVTIKLAATDSNGNSGSASVTVNLGCQIVGAINTPLSSPNPANPPEMEAVAVGSVSFEDSIFCY